MRQQAVQFCLPTTCLSTSPNEVALKVTIVNDGIAPFYYDFRVELECPGLAAPLQVDGVDALIDKGQHSEFVFEGVPADQECLRELSLKLNSSYAYKGKPIKFAQGDDGTVALNIPAPGARSFVGPQLVEGEPISGPPHVGKVITTENESDAPT